MIKERPKSPDRLPPSLQPTPPAQAQAQPQIKTTTKSKAEKMYEIELRKLRSLAKPLDSKMQATGERRFFQWAVGVPDDVKKWEGGGKIERKWEKVWVPVVSLNHRVSGKGLMVDYTYRKIVGPHDCAIQISSSERPESGKR